MFVLVKRCFDVELGIYIFDVSFMQGGRQKILAAKHSEWDLFLGTLI